jgi:hypothetical protein
MELRDFRLNFYTFRLQKINIYSSKTNFVMNNLSFILILLFDEKVKFFHENIINNFKLKTNRISENFDWSDSLTFSLCKIKLFLPLTSTSV